MFKAKSLKLKVIKILRSKFLRFCLVGGFCALLNLFILYILTTILNWHYILSTIFLMFSVNVLGFYLNKRYTFKTEKKRFWRELWKYQTVMFSSFITILLLMYLLVDVFRIWYIYANIIITVGTTSYNFLMHKNWSFR